MMKYDFGIADRKPNKKMNISENIWKGIVLPLTLFFENYTEDRWLWFVCKIDFLNN